MSGYAEHAGNGMVMPRPHELLTGPFKLIVRAARTIVLLRATRSRSSSYSVTVREPSGSHTNLPS